MSLTKYPPPISNSLDGLGCFGVRQPCSWNFGSMLFVDIEIARIGFGLRGWGAGSNPVNAQDVFPARSFCYQGASPRLRRSMGIRVLQNTKSTQAARFRFPTTHSVTTKAPIHFCTWLPCCHLPGEIRFVFKWWFPPAPYSIHALKWTKWSGLLRAASLGGMPVL